MISLIYGVPGSGKTYYATHYIKSKLLVEDEIFFRVKDHVLLITNIKLNLSDTDGYLYIQDMHDFLKYCSVDFLEKLHKSNTTKRKKVVYVIDEAQRLFALAKREEELYFFFQYHRHYSVDILLITQTPSSLPKKIYEITEYVVEAVPKSVNFMSKFSFRYRVKHPLDRDIILRRIHLRFDPAIFYLYSDMIYKDEEQKVENAFLKPVALSVLFIIASIFVFHIFLSSVSKFLNAQKTPTPTTPQAQHQQQQPQQQQQKTIPPKKYQEEEKIDIEKQYDKLLSNQR